jgi:hypothetical protein
MSNSKISALTSATTPLAGTEVLPIVQSGATKKVAVDDLTVKNIRSNATSGILQITGPAAASTRVATVPDANWTAARTDASQSFTGDQTLSTGNLVIGTSGKGIDFSATPGTGTSELLADYEEGTWTPVVYGTTAAGVGTYTTQVGNYTKIGNTVRFNMTVVWTAHTGTGNMRISGLPFTPASGTQYTAFSIAGGNLTIPANTYLSALCFESLAAILVYASNTTTPTNVNALAIDAAATLYISGTYQA